MNSAALEAVALYFPAAIVLSITPGTDTVLVLRSASSGGSGAGVLASLGVALGCAIWAALAAFGLAALVAASQIAYTALKWIGASYLLWLGVRALLRPRTKLDAAKAAKRASSFADGLLTNLLNPKVGIFYVSFLPQFVPPGVPVVSMVLLLGAIHAALSLMWLCIVALATDSLSYVLQRPKLVGLLDRATGVVFIAFAARLALTA
ncbi:MAG TPA: LysE family translocator [Polyangiales bacterium]|nr:LysE family translocator [Polyangiales bacterium]